jgi:signal transduction histidine kinase
MSAVLDDALTLTLREQVDRLVSFNRHVAHYLRSPLSTVACAAQRAEQALAAGDVATALHLLRLLSSRAGRLSDLVTALMSLAQAGEAPWHETVVDLNALAHDVADELGLRTGRTTLNLHPLPPVLGVSPLLRQVLANLLGNALKYSQRAAQPHIEVGTMAHAPSAAQVTVYVRDNGVGFDPDQAERLFQPFSRLHGGDYAGHGIGLSFVKRVIERHGGRVWAQCCDPVGAQFCFTLPTAVACASPGGGAAGPSIAVRARG